MILLWNNHPFSFTCHNVDDFFRINWWMSGAHEAAASMPELRKNGPRGAQTRANVNCSLLWSKRKFLARPQIKINDKQDQPSRMEMKVRLGCWPSLWVFVSRKLWLSYDFTIPSYRFNGCCFVIVRLRVFRQMPERCGNYCCEVF